MPILSESSGVESLSKYFDYYQSKVKSRGANQRERNLRHMSRTFNRYFENTLNRHDCLLNGEKASLVFQDHSQSNNKDLSDDKYVVAPNDVPIQTGDYIEWLDSFWVVFTKEFKTIRTHQQVKIKEANELIKWIKADGTISNGGKGWPAYAQSQTLYTMGVVDTNYLQLPDSKVSLFLKDNEETRELKMNKRIFVGGRVYRTQYINRISRPGLLSFLLDEDTIGPNDNRELEIADYHLLGTPNESESENPTEPSHFEIKGETLPKIGRIYEYKVSGTNVTEWMFSHSLNENPFYTVKQDESSIQIQLKDDHRNIGEFLDVIAKTESGEYITLNTIIAAKF